MDRAPWQNPRVLSTLICVFVSGVVFGALAMRLSAPPERHRGSPWKDSAGRDISLQRFKKDLDLSPAQAKEVETVLDDFMTYYQTLQAQMDDVRATGKERILRILRDDQKQKFEQMIVDVQSKQLR